VRIGHRHILVLLVVLALQAAGCTSSQWPALGPRQSMDLQVQQRVGGQATDLTAGEILRIMRRIGLVDDQILVLGPNLHDAIRSTGAAALTRGGRPEVMFAVNEDHLFVQTRSKGSFIYDLKEKRLIPVPPMPAEY
jgi:hypothetical protein